MEKEFDFKVELENSLKKVSQKEKRELLEMIFKTYVAKSLEVLMEKTGLTNGLEYDMLDHVKRNLIEEFRGANLGVNQISTFEYESLFNKAMQELLNEASLAHEGEDSADYSNSVLEINANEYMKNGLYVPKHLAD